MKFYLDGNEVKPAINWQDIDVSLKVDKQLNIFLLFQDFDLQFDADGYDYLSNIIYNQSFCTEVDIRIDKFCNGEYVLLFAGKIFISDCSVDEQTCIVTAKVQDRSFFYSINNNKNIKTSLDAEYTKNKEPIATTIIYNLDVRDVSTLAVTRTVEACRVEEAFRYFVDFMTDNSVSFVSDTFGANGTWGGLCITTGKRLRGVVPSLTDARWVTTSFLELFTEINRRIPLVLMIENPFTNPIVRIESQDYLYNNNVSLILSDVDKIETKFDNQKLYALIKFSSPTDLTNQLDFPENIDFFGFKEEEFHILGKCNLDQSLDLTCEWVTSSNVIQLVVDTAVTDWDNDLFLINSTGNFINTGITTNDNFFNTIPPYYHYNYQLNNENITRRYNEDLANSIASYYINSQDGKAYAYMAAPLDHITFYQNENFTNFLPIESYDYGNNYDPFLSRYIAPQKAIYTVKAKITILFDAQTGTNGNYFQMWLEHYDSSNNLIKYYEIAKNNKTLSNSAYLPGDYYVDVDSFVTKSWVLNETINMNDNDYLTMKIVSYPDGYPQTGFGTGDTLYQVLSGSDQTFLEIVDTSFTGGIFNTVDPNNFKIQLHQFDYPLTYNEWTTIINNPNMKVGFGMKNRPYRYGWIQQLKYNHSSGIASFTISTSKSKENAS